MKFIKTIVDLINFAIDKGEAGYFSPDEIVDQVNYVVLEMFNEFMGEYPGNKEISKYLDPFKKSTLLKSTNGAASIKHLKWEKQEFAVSNNNSIIPILELDEFYSRINSAALPPSDKYPIAAIKDSTILIRPENIKFTFYYLERPTEAKYAYTVDGDDYVYDDNKSVDVQFTNTLHPRIRDRVLKGLGINLREGTLVQFSNIQQQLEPK